MPIISQSALSRLMQTVNEADAELGRSLQTSTDQFGDELSKIWESAKAHEFATKVEEATKELHESYKKYIEDTHRGLEQNVKNHNMFNNAQVVLSALALTNPMIAISSKVKEMFADGQGDEMGLRKGHKASEVIDAFDKLDNELSSAMEKAVSGITSSGAFDEDEIRAVANAFRKMYEKTKEAYSQLKGEAKNALGIVDEDAAKLSQTNVSNMGS